MNAREAAIVTRAVEALEDGDRDLAVDVLVALVRESAPKPKGVRCPYCSWTGTWPGERDRHVGLLHGFGEAEAA